jgi:hypothetical protein
MAKPNTVTIDGEEYETLTVEYKGKKYVLRELNVDENDEIETASTDAKGTFNGKLNLRLCLVKSIVSPPTGMDDLGKWSGKKYLTMSRAFNKLNALQEDAEGNDSALPSSAGPTSPTSGDDSPTN